MPALSQPYPHPVAVRRMHYDPDFPLMFGGSGAWQVYAHRSVRQVLYDFNSFSNTYMPQDTGYIIGSNLNQTDPPLHPKLRALIAQPFTKTAIAAKEGQIRQQCEAMLAPLLQQGQMDFTTQFAFPFTAAVIGGIMGLPQSTYGQVNEWAKAIVNAGYTDGGMEKAAQAQQQMFQLFSGLLELRNQRPEDDLLTRLAGACLDGEPLPIPVKVATAMTVLLAGHETTAALLGNAMQVFIELPEAQDGLRRQPELIPKALWEVLRLRPSLVSMYRVATKDTELEGETIKEGQIVNAWISAANRDPEIFKAPDSFSLERESTDQILSFGYGLHHCVGDTLAKTEARITFEVLFSKLQDVRQQGAAIAGISGIVSGPQSLLVSFTLIPEP